MLKRFSIIITYFVVMFNTPQFIKQHFIFYKTWLGRLLGIKSISNFSCFVYTLLAFLLGIILLMSLLVLDSLLPDGIQYCMDESADARNELLAKISKVEDNIKYFSEQAKEADKLFKESLQHGLSNELQEERLEAKRDTEINLNIEKKVYRTLKNRLELGNFDSSLSTTSSLGKRNFDE